MENKSDKIIKDSKERGIPIFVITAKDVSSIPTLQEYLTNCALDGAGHDHRIDVQARIDEFRQWQIEHPTEVKIPD